ncbi:hypothetical protein [Nesterenkonia muleiensis]|uniref:hypothetical protein n=1 Tax=Nesterenkonia muleiensis TaxID=2282648 RepID=UPI000E71AE68|nr:hypothetical protein [Nesterenkonia muleiensis]
MSTPNQATPNTVKAYAHDVKDWFVFLSAEDLDRREVRLKSVGEFLAPCLGYLNHEMNHETLVPIDEDLSEAIAEQRCRLHERRPDGANVKSAPPRTTTERQTSDACR